MPVRKAEGFGFSWHPHSAGRRSVVRKETNTFRHVPRRKQSSVQDKGELQKLPSVLALEQTWSIEKDAAWQDLSLAVHTEVKQQVAQGQ